MSGASDSRKRRARPEENIHPGTTDESAINDGGVLGPFPFEDLPTDMQFEVARYLSVFEHQRLGMTANSLKHLLVVKRHNGAFRRPAMAYHIAHATSRRVVLKQIPNATAIELMTLYGLRVRIPGATPLKQVLSHFIGISARTDRAKDKEAYRRMARCYVDWLHVHGSDSVFDEVRATINEAAGHGPPWADWVGDHSRRHIAGYMFCYMIATQMKSEIQKTLATMSKDREGKTWSEYHSPDPSDSLYDQVVWNMTYCDTMLDVVPPLDIQFVTDVLTRLENMFPMSQSIVDDYLYPAHRGRYAHWSKVPEEQVINMFKAFLLQTCGATLPILIKKIYGAVMVLPELNTRGARAFRAAFAVKGRVYEETPLAFERNTRRAISVGDVDSIDALFSLGILDGDYEYPLFPPMLMLRKANRDDAPSINIVGTVGGITDVIDHIVLPAESQYRDNLEELARRCVIRILPGRGLNLVDLSQILAQDVLATLWTWLEKVDVRGRELLVPAVGDGDEDEY